MSRGWYVHEGSQRWGPYSSAQLRHLAASGRLRPTTLVSREGGRRGAVPAGSIHGLFSPGQSPAILPHASGLGEPGTWIPAGSGASQPRETPSHGKRCEQKGDTGVVPIPSGHDPVPGATELRIGQASQIDHAAAPWRTSRHRRRKLLAAVGATALLCSCCLCAGLLGVGPSKPTANTAEDRRLEAQFGKKPFASPWDGSLAEVKDYLVRGLNDPNSLEYVGWSNIVPLEEGWSVRLKYRAKNLFGGYVTKNQIFVIRHGRVVAVTDVPW